MKAGPRVPSPDDCPRCGAPKEKRIDATAFGPKRQILCGACGHEFPDDAEAA